MAGELPDYFFRIKENGASVFRLDKENRHRRIEMEQIASLNVRNGEIKPHGDRPLTGDEMKAIRGWMASRTALLADRELAEIARTVEHLNLAAQWAQARASDDQLDAVTDDLLLAMHDLRSVLVRKKSERLGKDDPAGA